MKNNININEAKNKISNPKEIKHKLNLIDSTVNLEDDKTNENSLMKNKNLFTILDNSENKSFTKNKNNWSKVHNIFRGIRIFKNIQADKLNDSDGLNV